MIRKGSIVRLRVGTKGVGRGRRGKAVVVARLSDIKGGVFLDRHLGGYRYWNIADLEHIRRPRS